MIVFRNEVVFKCTFMLLLLLRSEQVTIILQENNVRQCTRSVEAFGVRDFWSSNRFDRLQSFFDQYRVRL